MHTPRKMNAMGHDLLLLLEHSGVVGENDLHFHVKVVG
jgi:hypothetical protein